MGITVVARSHRAPACAAARVLGPEDDIAALQKLNEEDVVRRFMSDPRFGDAILDFNMYFLGFKIDNVKIDGDLCRQCVRFPQCGERGAGDAFRRRLSETLRSRGPVLHGALEPWKIRKKIPSPRIWA